MVQSHGALPDQILVSADRRSLTLVWPDKTGDTLSATALRAACRCGWCTRDRALGQFQETFEAVTLAGAELLGSHGLHLKFSDGHQRGIFPWPYLEDLCRRPVARTRHPDPAPPWQPASSLRTPSSAPIVDPRS